MEFTLPKIAIFLLINAVALTAVGTLLFGIVADQFWDHPFLLTLELAVLAVIFPLFEVSYFLEGDAQVFHVEDQGRVSDLHNQEAADLGYVVAEV